MTSGSILVVEDDLSNVQGTIALLENAGVSVQVASTVQAAKNILAKYSFDLMLIDWTIPLVSNGPADRDGGAKLVDFLNGPEAPPLNRDAKYYIITKQTDQFASGSRKEGARMGVLSKLDALSIVEVVEGFLRLNARQL